MKSLFANITDLSRKKPLYLRIKQAPDKNMPSACDFCDIKIDKLFCQTFLDCNSASNAFY